jgi:hypothetical protein
MKFLTKLAVACAAFVLASSSVSADDTVSCAMVDFLYYSNECCDSSNTVECLKSISSTSKLTIDQLSALKKANGDPCVHGDTVTYVDDVDSVTDGAQPGLVCSA